MDAAATASLIRSSVLPRKASDNGAGSMFLTASGPGFTRSGPGRQLRFRQNAFARFSRPLQSSTARRSFVVKASASNDDASSSAAKPIAPLQLESPAGQFLSQILVTHPHLVPAAVEQQLEQLQTDRDSEGQNKDASSVPGTDIVLYRRIAELKENERRKTLEEILYALVVQKFMEANVSLVPSITPSSSDPSGRVDTWPTKVEKLEKLHSSEMYEMIHNHLALILGPRMGDLASVAQISKLRVGQVYAASVMYGYFLKRVDQRFQLEKSMKLLSGGLDESKTSVEQPENVTFKAVSSHPEVGSFAGGVSAKGFGSEIKPSRLRTYVMSFDSETLQRYATIRSREAVGIIEKHTEALFGKPEIVITPEGTVDSSKDEQIKISFGGMKRLVLEAVTFGSFLWDVESHVDARYHFVLN
ncbi:UV-B-induced protein At3g17800, chloroplastic [Brassica rapa]|uniref:UV-B-induced protein At3g17800, chloroplastic n=1 Tax=Brassica campestris TaxID=3711 RepID=UPI00142E65DE|nr:UV-B-induced protein At3g17800, chloroplastic [Brassica rapa]XP_013749482.2 UV-B-induced protein At3g17800, chloroplastic [Brassica napus]